MVAFGDGVILVQYSYDTTAAKELDKIMSKYYPGIVCTRSYTLDLYDRTIEFHFEFDAELEDDNFD